MEQEPQRVNFLAAVFHWLTSASNWDGPDGITSRAIAQLELSLSVIVAAGIVGIGLGFGLGHSGHGGFVAVNSANAARAVPSLALLTLLVTWPEISLKGNGVYASFLTLLALAIPPILTNAYIAMREVDPDLLEAATSVGMSSWQRFVRVEIPLAAPLAVAGLRTAAIEVVATSTLAAYVSFNDLGVFIFAGLDTNNSVESFSAALIVATLAACTDLAFLAVYRLVRPVTGSNDGARRQRLRRSSTPSVVAS
jgi:osmoprotectant transport system permease protein